MQQKEKRKWSEREEQTLRQVEKRQHRTTWQHWGKSPQAFPQQLHTLWYHPLSIDPWSQTKNKPHTDSITQISETMKDWIFNRNWVNGTSVTQKYRFSQKGIDRGIWYPLRCVDLRRWQPSGVIELKSGNAECGVGRIEKATACAQWLIFIVCIVTNPRSVPTLDFWTEIH